MESVEDTYEKLVSIVKTLSDVQAEIGQRGVVGVWRHPFASLSLMFKSAFGGLGGDLLTSKLSPELRAFFEITSPPELRRNEFYTMILDPHTYESLARYTLRSLALTPAGIKKLHLLHGEKGNELKRADVKTILAAILGGGALLSKTVSKEVFDFFGWDYPRFQLITSFFVLGLLGYASLILAPLWLRYSRSTTLHASVGRLLTYCEILVEPEDDAYQGLPPQVQGSGLISGDCPVGQSCS